MKLSLKGVRVWTRYLVDRVMTKTDNAAHEKDRQIKICPFFSVRPEGRFFYGKKRADFKAD